MDAGVFIMHRCHGATTDLALEFGRAVTKMKATITQRFVLRGVEIMGAGGGGGVQGGGEGGEGKGEDVEVDAEADCRFCFFWEKDPGTKEWRARFVRHWYEKDKLIPVNPARVPVLDERRLRTYPSGYRYLSYCQEVVEGRSVRRDMPGRVGEAEEEGKKGDLNVNREEHDRLLGLCRRWVEGEEGVVV